MIGDIVQLLDQGFTFPDGKPGGIVYCIAPDGSVKWGASNNLSFKPTHF
jgi:hypothetical protein